MRIAVIVLSLELPDALKRILPLIVPSSLTEILRLPAGAVMNLHKAIVSVLLAPVQIARERLAESVFDALQTST